MTKLDLLISLVNLATTMLENFKKPHEMKLISVLKPLKISLCEIFSILSVIYLTLQKCTNIYACQHGLSGTRKKPPAT